MSKITAAQSQKIEAYALFISDTIFAQMVLAVSNFRTNQAGELTRLEAFELLRSLSAAKHAQ